MMPVLKHAATIKDVAARAAVSISTVSRVINDLGVTRTETTERVKAAISELGFRPHGVGRSLKTARTGTIGVMIPSIANPVFAEAVAGMETAATGAGLTLLLASSGYRESEEARAVDTLRYRGVDGLILTVADPERSVVLDGLDRDRVPYVLIYNAPVGQGRPTVTVDNDAAGHETAARFLARGHRQLGMIAGSFAASDRSRARYRGFRAGVGQARRDELVLVEVDFSNLRLKPALAPIFRGSAPPTALFCSNDLVAIAVMGALRALRLSVPGDVSIVGFDGIAVGAMIEPTLATVVQPSRAMGEEAVRALIRRFDTGAPPGDTILEHRFRTGGSLSNAPLRRPIPNRTAATTTRAARGGTKPCSGERSASP